MWIEGLFQTAMVLVRRRGESGGCGSVGCIVLLLGLGLVIWLIVRSRRNAAEAQAQAPRPGMPPPPVGGHTFANPFPKCSNCGAAGDRMKQQWDGLRKVTWSCGYCGHSQVQELRDEELPPSARQKLGLDQPPAGYGYPGQAGQMNPGMGGGLGGLVTGMMLSSMLGGSSHHHHGGDGGSGGSSSGNDGGWDGGSSSGNDGSWDSGGDSGGGDWGGDSGGGDSGGGDW